jgi:D-alanyl-D-alanine carboxypeptidase
MEATMVARARSTQGPRWRRSIATVFASTVLLLAPVAGPAWAHPASPPSDAAAWCRDSGTTAQLDEAISTALRETGAPGAIVGVWGPHCAYEKAFGVADKATGAPMRTDFYHRIGSETKTFTVTGVLQLVDDGLVGLDDPIGDYIPGVPEGDRITLRQLARMQSGLFNYSEDEQFQLDLVTDPYRPFTPQELLGYAFAHPLDFPPGEGFHYSNTNTILLALVIERVSGLPLHQYIEERVLQPLGLEDTSFPTDNAFPQPHAQGYTRTTLDGSETVATDWNPSWGWAAGAMISTLEDMRTWARAVATGTLLEPETQAQRLETVTPPGFNPGAGYGLGIFDAQGWVGHNGSLPGYQTLTVYLPERHLTLVVLLNTDEPVPGSNGEAPSSAFGTAITQVISPDHVFDLSPA